MLHGEPEIGQVGDLSYLNNSERLGNFARELAARHQTVSQSGKLRNLLDLAQQRRAYLSQVQRYTSKRSTQELQPRVAVEWLLDNFYILQKTFQQVSIDLPWQFYRELPRLISGPLTAYPRNFEIAFELVYSRAGEIDMAEVRQFLLAYQEFTPLKMGELWSLPSMLRIALLDLLAYAFSEIFEEQFPLPDKTKPGEALRGISPDSIVANSVTSLRILLEEDWKDFFEDVSQVERILNQDPLNVYPFMEFETRDRYRREVEILAAGCQGVEGEVAQQAIHLASALQATHDSQAATHVGYYLVGSGRAGFEKLLGYRPKPRARLLGWIYQHATPLYLGLILFLATLIEFAAIAYAFTFGNASWQLVLIFALVLIPALSISTALVSWLGTNLLPARILPKMDFRNGIPAEFGTLVVIPSILSTINDVDSLARQLELHYLGNDDANTYFALLTDFVDAPQPSLPEDAALTEYAAGKIQALNAQYGGEKRKPFYLIHRERQWNACEQTWMGWERKRGKLEELNCLLMGQPNSFDIQGGSIDVLTEICFVITLDADTTLPPGSAQRLAGTLAHPLNRPEFDPQSGRVTSGYTILQPRTAIKLTSVNQSYFAMVYSGDIGIDLYSRAVSDVYQDLFGEGIYVGKGIYDVNSFYRSLKGRVPENALLSHDLFEGLHSRAALVSDIMLLEDYPPRYLAYSQRMHRWIRGDWQLLPWLFPKVPTASGARTGNPLKLIDRWKIFDNLRRSLTTPSILALLLATAIRLPGADWFWLGLALLAVGISFVTTFLSTLVKVFRQKSFSGATASLVDAGMRALFQLVFVPYEALISVDAVGTALVRMYRTKQKMLQWTTAAHTLSLLGKHLQLALSWRQMYGASLIGLAGAILALWFNRSPAFLLVFGLISLAWISSPGIAFGISLPRTRLRAELSEDDRRLLRKLARRTWLFFERFVTPQDNWLPPDHYQENPRDIVAHRTSPTNIGLMLASFLGAYDLGYLGVQDLFFRLENAFQTMHRVERHRGHFLNWYNTESLEPLQPRYVSTVDSGNLAACLWVVHQGCQEILDQRPINSRRWQGLLDTLDLLEESLGRLSTETTPQDGKLSADLVAIRSEVLKVEEKPDEWAAFLIELDEVRLPRLDEGLMDLVDLAPATLDAAALDSIRTWKERLRHHVRDMNRDIEHLMPWLAMIQRKPAFLDRPRPALTSLWTSLQEVLRTDPPMREIPSICERGQQIVQQLRFLTGELTLTQNERREILDWCAQMVGALQEGRTNSLQILAGFRSIADQAMQLADEMDFSFLYDAHRDLFRIGFHVDLGQLDANYYDLLASEARLAGFIAIARGAVPQDHWLHMSRPMARVGRMRTLVSWSGTMFEYLMPILFMRQLENSLLAESCEAAVEAQAAYASRLHLPWGMSESGFYLFDQYQNYQYRAFGVPDLGYRRGLGEDQVVTPYASILALPLRPQSVVDNLRRLIDLGGLNEHGFYEAFDFTRARLTFGERFAIVRSLMSHHQGMILLSLVNFLADNPMVSRFHANPRVQSMDLLLQEQMSYSPAAENPPQKAPEMFVQAREVRAREWRISPRTALPQAHWLSNGRYGVLITNGGAGFSRLGKIQLTRWGADTTLDPYGMWLYIQDRKEGTIWSPCQQPAGAALELQEIKYSPYMASFRSEAQQISSLLEITVSPVEDLEVRRLTLTNLSDRPRRLRVASYAEVALSADNLDVQHPAFNKLFMESEYLPDKSILIWRRRPRSGSEDPIYVAHTVYCRSIRSKSRFYEADRAVFLGRAGSSVHPLALSEASFSRTTGATLDPILCVGGDLILPAHASCQAIFLTAAANSRAAAVEPLISNQSVTKIDQIFDRARSQSESVLREAGFDSEKLAEYQRLLAFLFYPHRGQRAAPSILGTNSRGQPSLWTQSISGDYPILLIRIGTKEHAALVQDVLFAHGYWRSYGLKIDLVILDEEPGGYLQEAAQRVRQMLASTKKESWLNRSGGIFLLHREQMAEEDRILLESAARVVLDGSLGSLESQLASLEAPPDLPDLVPMPHPDRAELSMDPLERPADLVFDNSFGGFTPDGKEYVIYLGPGERTPAPWINVIANPEFGFMISESGGGNTWSLNSRENRLTPWYNDPLLDSPGEALYLRDEETGEVWTPTPLPAGEQAPYLIRHGTGYSTFTHHSHGLIQELRLFAPIDDPLKILELQLTNRWGHPRRITVTYFAEWVLGVNREEMQAYILPEFDREHNALLARNPYNTEFPGRVAFLASSKEIHGMTADRAEFLGRMGNRALPAALRRIGLAGKVEPGLDPCAVIQLHLDLPPGASEQVYFLIGEEGSQEEARALIEKYQKPAAIETASNNLQSFWDKILGNVQVHTPEPSLDILLNRWLLYQDLTCRLWGRSALYQSGGAYGFRDQLQDVMALLHAAPELAREHIVRAAGHQFEAGDVLHWWHPPHGGGLRTRISDNLLWLPYVTSRYIEITGDWSILEEEAPFLIGPPLAEGEDEHYFQAVEEGPSGPLFEHCRRAIERGATSGPHGLPLIGTGDWNDGLNRVGEGGQGESIWLGWFLYDVLNSFSEICRKREETYLAETYERHARELQQAIESAAWDGLWYRRAYYDDGSPLGSALNRECQIDSISQSWSVLSGGGEQVRAIHAMESVKNLLIDSEAQLILLFKPPFENTPRNPGYIKGYPPGIRENGGQYTHAALWSIWAFAQLGRSDLGMTLFQYLNPIHHSDSLQKALLYRVEPYVVAADIYGYPPHTGRGGWTWYTGSASWMYRLGLEALLGLKRTGDSLRIQPCIPPEWKGFEISYRYGSSVYHLHVDSSAGPGKEVAEVWRDGKRLAEQHVLLKDDGQEHTLKILLK